MNKVSLYKKKQVIVNYAGTCEEALPSWPLRTGNCKEPTAEEFAESVKKLTKEDRRRLLEDAGIIDKDGNITEYYRPL